MFKGILLSSLDNPEREIIVVFLYFLKTQHEAMADVRCSDWIALLKIRIDVFPNPAIRI